MRKTYTYALVLTSMVALTGCASSTDAQDTIQAEISKEQEKIAQLAEEHNTSVAISDKPHLITVLDDEGRAIECVAFNDAKSRSGGGLSCNWDKYNALYTDAGSPAHESSSAEAK